MGGGGGDGIVQGIFWPRHGCRRFWLEEHLIVFHHCIDIIGFRKAMKDRRED